MAEFGWLKNLCTHNCLLFSLLRAEGIKIVKSGMFDLYLRCKFSFIVPFESLKLFISFLTTPSSKQKMAVRGSIGSEDFSALT